MKYKPNWADARERLTALWQGRHLGRPCLTVMAPSGANVPVPVADSAEDYWLDADYQVQATLAHVANTYWGGEAMPSRLLMGGWVFCYGAQPHFDWGTIWHDPVPLDWDNPPALNLDWSDPYIQQYVRAYQAVVDAAGWDDFMVGFPCTLPGNDLLVALISNDQFLINLVDRPAWMREAILTIGRHQIEVMHFFREMASKTHAFPWGNCGWMTLWGPESYIATQSDVSCMLSPEMFDEFVLPELDLLAAHFGHMWYHLDGSRAFQHLPRLLSLEYLRIIQFVPEPDVPPNGPEWLDLYRTIQAAGKAVHISVPVADVEPLVRALDPGLLCLETWVSSPDEADALLRAAERWTKAGTI